MKPGEPCVICTREREIGELVATVRAIDRNVTDVKAKVEALTPDVITAKAEKEQERKVTRAVWALFVVIVPVIMSFLFNWAAKTH